MYLSHLKEKSHLEIVLKVFQTISLNKPLAETTIKNEFLISQFIPSIKKSEIDLQINSLRMVGFQDFYFFIIIYFSLMYIKLLYYSAEQYLYTFACIERIIRKVSGGCF